MLLSFCLLCNAVPTSFGQAKPKPQLPGKAAVGTLLPNGWTLTPEGKQIPVSDLPMNMILSNDGRYLLVTTNGNGDQTVDIINLTAGQSVQTIKVAKSWLGIALSPDGKRLFVSGGDDNEILVYDFAVGKATAAGKINLGSEDYHKLDGRGRDAARRAGTGEFAFPSGIAVTPDGKWLYAAENLTHKVAVVDLASQKVVKKIEVGEYPYDCEIARDGKRLYVSNWGSRSLAVIDTTSNSVTATIPVGDHPNDIELTKDGKTLYVANANSNTVSVVDTAQLKEIEAISTALHPKSPAGSTPNAVALSPDEKTLFIANADNNNVAIADVAKRGAAEIEGFIPTGWYPTSVRVSKDGKRIFVANGKGTASAANPNGPTPLKGRTNEYIGSMLKGTISLIDLPGKAKLAQLTKRTYANSPYTDALLKAARAPKEKTAIPVKLGEASPIKHVIYVIKENRTYDQVLGDMKEGNGDPNLTLFGEEVTPNQHALAREFVLLDNFYVDAEVSADGHNWSMAAYATDYVEKTWPTNYSQRGRTYDYEGSKKISRPTGGYIWDYCKRAGVSYRSYGEFVGVRDVKVGGGGGNESDTAAAAKARKENFTSEDALIGHFSPTFPAYDLSITDNTRVDRWLEEFREFEKNGQLPQFQIVRLGNNHTQGTRAGVPTPRAYVAENDLALGRLVEAVSNSKYWASTAIFVLEDDAQNGPDHVDAHRSIAFVASPYTKRGVVDSTMYTTSGMLRTMELILGLPPMSQYDGGATPMFNSFTAKSNLTPFKLRPAKIDLTEKNTSRSPGAQQSAMWDFSKEDTLPDIEFNEVIWKSVKGANSPMPAPVRSAFVRAIDDDDEKEEKEPRKQLRRSKR
ncbi:MAG: beta-propeller fold lactonase family protein [Blastocatellia bacterium]